jgi:hypothetical protein
MKKPGTCAPGRTLRSWSYALVVVFWPILRRMILGRSRSVLFLRLRPRWFRPLLRLRSWLRVRARLRLWALPLPVPELVGLILFDLRP